MASPAYEAQRLQGLQALRAVAAACVVIQHAVLFSSAVTPSPPDIRGFLSVGFGNLGVYIFFVLSGAVMAFAGGQSAGRFAVRRILRIYPPLLLALLLAALITPFGGAPRPAWDWSLLLVPTGNIVVMLQIPYWTLIYEMVFYAIVALLLLFRVPPNARIALFTMWVVAICINDRFGIALDPVRPDWTILLSPLNLHFVSGYVLGLAILKRNADGLAMFAFISAVVVVTVAPRVSVMVAYSAMGAAAVYIGVILSTRALPRFATRTGDLSYGLYLFHMPAQYLLIFTLAKPAGWSFWWTVPAALAVGGASGLAFGFVEHGVNRILMRRIGRGSARQAASDGLPQQTAEMPPAAAG